MLFILLVISFITLIFVIDIGYIRPTNNTIKHPTSKIHIIDCNKENPLNIKEWMDKCWIEADTVNNTIYYRVYFTSKEDKRN